MKIYGFKKNNLNLNDIVKSANDLGIEANVTYRLLQNMPLK